jgi:membrane protease YdiL (CAAX protease family)
MSARSFSSDEEHDFSADLIRGLDDFETVHSGPSGDGDPLSGPGADGGGTALDDRGPDDSYWALSRTPLTSLAFTLPLVLAYEGGVLLLGRGTPRNGADVWLRQALDGLGFGQYFLLPVLTIVGLLAWHHVQHDRWRFSPAVLVGMCVECVILALLLVGLARLQSRFWPLAIGDGAAAILARFVGYCGAGLYEEVLFRLLMLPIAVWAFERLGCATLVAAFWALLVSSLLFSAAHYIGPLGDSFALYSFTFRAVAGLFFAMLFLLRGFGIAAGTHFFYDLLVGLL